MIFFNVILIFQVKTELELVRLRVSSAMGAAWLAARHVDYDLPRDDSAFCDVFYTYRPSEVNGNINGNVNNNVNFNGSGNVNGNVKINGTIENGYQGCGCEDWSNWS